MGWGERWGEWSGGAGADRSVLKMRSSLAPKNARRVPAPLLQGGTGSRRVGLRERLRFDKVTEEEEEEDDRVLLFRFEIKFSMWNERPLRRGECRAGKKNRERERKATSSSLPWRAALSAGVEAVVEEFSGRARGGA